MLRVRTAGGIEEHRAQAVLDATGTWGVPQPAGRQRAPALGEREHAERIAYGMPDILGTHRARYAGKRVVVAGAGHSAAGNLLALAKLSESDPATRIVWTIRGRNFARIFGGGENDGLVARGARRPAAAARRGRAGWRCARTSAPRPSAGRRARS